MLKFEVNANPAALVKCSTTPQMRKLLNLLAPAYTMSDALSMLIAETLYAIEGRLSEARFICNETPIDFLDHNVRQSLYAMHRYQNLDSSTFQRSSQELNRIIRGIRRRAFSGHAIAERSMKRELKKLGFVVERGTHIRAAKPIKTRILRASLIRPDAMHPEWAVTFHITNNELDFVDVNMVDRTVRTEADLRKEVERIEKFVTA
jgi:hypothetical protein